MELTFRSLAAYVTLLYLLYKSLSFIRFYIAARRTGFAIFVTPVFSQSILWLALAPMLRPYFEKYLPHCIYRRLDLTIHGWEFRRRADIRRYVDSDVFVIVCPDGCQLL
jgi:hypothetical protein